jgi:hypothetical protein
MDGISPDKLDFRAGKDLRPRLRVRHRDQVGRHVLKLVAIAAADEQAAQVLLHDLATLSQKREGTPQHNAARWQRRLNRALDRARYDTPKADPAKTRALEPA